MTNRNGRAVGLAVAALGLVAALPATASAVKLSGKPFALATPYEVDNAAVAVNPSTGTGYFAWSNTHDLPSVAATNIVQYCVVPKGATACQYSGSLTPADGGQYIDNAQILVDDSTVVIIADVYGTQNDDAGDYEPEQEWQSTDGGASWTTVASGLSVSDGVLDADTEPINAVIVPGTGELGYGWETADGPPTFNAFPLSAAGECSTVQCNGTAIPDGGPYPFAQLEPATNPDQVANGGAAYAAQSGANPGVLGVFMTDFNNGPFACKLFGTAFAYGAGDQSATNNYNLSPGTGGSAWLVPATQLDCDVEYFAVGGGPSGFGVLDTNTDTEHTVYHAFDAAHKDFDTKPVTVNAKGEQQPSLSQDGAGGVYATYLLNGAGGPLELSYSGDAGAIWETNAINKDSDGGISDMTSAVGSEGQGWATWFDNGTVYAQQFDANDAAPPLEASKLTTAQTSGTSHGANLSVPAGTVGEYDAAKLSGTNAFIATGKVKYALYSDSACSKLAVSADTSAVKYGKPNPSTVVAKRLEPGTYYWQASYGGDVSNKPSTSKCGSEVLTVRPPATSGSSASASSSTLTVTVKCGEPCKVAVTVTSGSTTIATGHATFATAGAKSLALNLTGAGKALLKSDGGSLSATVQLKTKTAKGTFTTSSPLKIS